MNVEVKVPSVTREVANFAANLRYEELPQDVIAMAKRCILDSIACGVYGADKPWTQSVARVVARLQQNQMASAWGSKLRADPLGVALINGTASQGFELDDCHDQSMSHYGAGVVPPVIAAAEGLGTFDGKQIILATVVGYELGTRIGNTVSPSAFHRGFHPCGLTSTFAAAGTLGKLLELNVDQFVSAIGLAGSQAAGLMASQYGAMAKRFHSGKAAQNGMMAAMAAQEGLTGVRNVLEASYGGFCSTYSEEYDLSYATDGLGTDYEMLHNGFKQYAALASSHATVDCLRLMREKHGLRAEDAAAVLVETTEMVHRHCGWRYVPAETITAQMNLPFTAAVTLRDGHAFIDQYRDENLRDPALLDLANRVEVVIAPDLDALGKHEMRAVRVTVTTKSGQKYTEGTHYRSGHWKKPIPDAQLKAKYRDLAGRVLTPEAVSKIEQIVSTLETQATPGASLGAELQKLRA